jgi:hypothetical protein
LPALLDIDAHQHRNRHPNHKNKEKECISNISSGVSNQADEKWAQERARLYATFFFRYSDWFTEKDAGLTLSVIEKSPNLGGIKR